MGMIVGTPETWSQRALAGEPVWNIGQLCPATIRALRRLVTKGRLIELCEQWCNLGPKRSLWLSPAHQYDFGFHLIGKKENA